MTSCRQEFGGITGIFAPDHVTADFISQRKLKRYKDDSHYFKADEGCHYVESHIIDLSKAEPFVAKYPNPDDVVPVSEMKDINLDGCFIGACTTAEEDIIMGALVLQEGLKAGNKPISKGKRRVTPGSRPITDMLKRTGLYEVYEKAGFEIGVPGCSYCVGIAADVAQEGDVWLSSQNRNFKNRMGRGSIGNLASAATVAACSFDMKVTSPNDLVSKITDEQWESVKGKGSLSSTGSSIQPQWVEPPEPTAEAGDSNEKPTEASSQPVTDKIDTDAVEVKMDDIQSKVYRLEDFIDTDALAPAQYLVTAKDDEELGSHCLEYTHPDFRERVKDGSKVVVAGKAFGCGSSRLEAVQALLGIGVKCVIARSFAFIYSRNQPSIGLVGITIQDEAFYDAAQDGTEIDVDLENNVAKVGGKEFPFEFSQIEKSLTGLGGVAPAFNKFGKHILDALTSGHRGAKKSLKEHGKAGAPLSW